MQDKSASGVCSTSIEATDAPPETDVAWAVAPPEWIDPEHFGARLTQALSIRRPDGRPVTNPSELQKQLGAAIRKAHAKRSSVDLKDIARELASIRRLSGRRAYEIVLREVDHPRSGKAR